jgi:hypothetical protein
VTVRPAQEEVPYKPVGIVANFLSGITPEFMESLPKPEPTREQDIFSNQHDSAEIWMERRDTLAMVNKMKYADHFANKVVENIQEFSSKPISSESIEEAKTTTSIIVSKAFRAPYDAVKKNAPLQQMRSNWIDALQRSQEWLSPNNVMKACELGDEFHRQASEFENKYMDESNVTGKMLKEIAAALKINKEIAAVLDNEELINMCNYEIEQCSKEPVRSQPETRKRFADALFFKSDALSQLGKFEEATTTRKELDRRFGKAAKTEPELREPVANHCCPVKIILN